jgi:hypothetical protein
MSKNRKTTYVRIRHASSLASIARRYAEGESVRTLTEEYDIDPSTVRNIARRFGVPIRPRGRPTIGAGR